ncbi:MAG: SWIM zinc finger family protein [Deltaproteobacteria bacterium]|nr:SWIM zinc finger family protein [Deltaproteobacteria bacterium]
MGIKDESKNLTVSKKVIKKAKTLKVEEIGEFMWLVSGGTEPHVVQPSLENPAGFFCDCLAYQYRGVCSHILAVELHLKGGEK